MSWLTGGTRKPGMFRSWPEALVMLGCGAFLAFMIGWFVYELVTL